jgi:hypothetical protein
MPAPDDRLTAELADIKERTEKASPGPWKFEREHLHDMDDAPFSLPSVVGPDGREIFGGHVDAPGADLRFAARARADVPRLAKALEEVLKLVDGAKPVLTASPADCTYDCDHGPCNCSGVGRPLGWDLDPAALRGAITTALTGKAADDG